MAQRAWVLIDGDCGLCKHFGAWVRRMDRPGRFTVVPFQTAPDPPVNAALRKRCESAMHVVDEEGRVYRGGDAFVFIRRALQKPLGGIMGIQPFKSLVDLSYWIVSNNRDKFAPYLYAKEKWVG
ncbi:MAG: DUF393 domain-containing protein [Armatimonadota bacterium]|nr:DUF393 domain-containing protein [Armatimonadota bacterium]